MARDETFGVLQIPKVWAALPVGRSGAIKPPVLRNEFRVTSPFIPVFIREHLLVRPPARAWNACAHATKPLRGFGF